jgi:hypothetical protein
MRGEERLAAWAASRRLGRVADEREKTPRLPQARMSVSRLSSTFFPPPYRPDLDGPPLSILDIAKQKLLSVTEHFNLPGSTIHIEEQQQHLDLLTDSPGYATFFLTSLNRYERLLNAKPVLIQGVFFSPWAFCLPTLPYTCTETRTRRGRPMETPCRRDAPQQDLRTKCSAHILDTHKPLADARVPRQRSACLPPSSTPSMTSSLADPTEVRDHIRALGLQSIRAKRLIALSAAYACEYAYQDQDQDHTPISHLPGSGPYALDSYRIYCGGPDAWRTVMPRDKELIRFIVRLSYL